MKAVILAGSLGTRPAEVTVLRPKPMVEIGGKPILWHIMKETQQPAPGWYRAMSGCGDKNFRIQAQTLAQTDQNTSPP